MLELRLELGYERLLRGLCGVEQAPYRAAAVAVFGTRADGVASLEGEVWLDAMNGGKVVVLDFAQLEKAKATNCQCLFMLSLGRQRDGACSMQVRKPKARVRDWLTYFSQHLGASSTNRSMVISPSDVSSSTDMVWAMLCRERVFVANVRQRARQHPRPRSLDA